MRGSIETFNLTHNHNYNCNKNRNNNDNRGRYRKPSLFEHLKIESHCDSRRARGQSSATVKKETGSGREGRRTAATPPLPVKVLRAG